MVGDILDASWLQGSPPPKHPSARGSLPLKYGAAGALLPTTERSAPMTGVIFLLAVSALLGGSLVLSRDA